MPLTQAQLAFQNTFERGNAKSQKFCNHTQLEERIPFPTKKLKRKFDAISSSPNEDSTLLRPIKKLKTAYPESTATTLAATAILKTAAPSELEKATPAMPTSFFERETDSHSSDAEDSEKASSDNNSDYENNSAEEDSFTALAEEDENLENLSSLFNEFGLGIQ